MCLHENLQDSWKQQRQTISFVMSSSSAKKKYIFLIRLSVIVSSVSAVQRSETGKYNNNPWIHIIWWQFPRTHLLKIEIMASKHIFNAQIYVTFFGSPDVILVLIHRIRSNMYDAIRWQSNHFPVISGSIGFHIQSKIIAAMEECCTNESVRWLSTCYHRMIRFSAFGKSNGR